MPDAAAQLHSTIPPELKAILVQQLVDWGVAAVRSGWRRWWYAFRKIDKREALYKWYLQELVEHFSTIEALDQLVPFTGSLGVDRFLLWPELEGESRRSADKQNSAVQDGEPLLPRKLKATELLTHPLSNKRLFAVEGAAGVGKTTMARALARFAAKQTLELMELKGEDGSQVQYLPLYFNAEDLIKLAESTPVGQVSPSGEGALKDLLGGVLQKPNRALLVIVDGLDEVEGPVRTKALIALRGLWLPGGNHRYLLLGRPGSIRNVTWVKEEEAALKLSLKPWGEEEVREYLGRWTKKGGRPHLEVAELDQLVEYIRSRVGLPSPALQVQMVVASYVELKRDGLENPLEQMPATRTELYRHYLRLLLERREGDKALQGAGSTAHPADLERRKWLGCLELLLRLFPEQRERARAQKCSANHLPDVAAAQARGRSCGKLLREEADFTKWWEDRKLCRLGHESLHEFLAAEALAKLYQGDPQGFWKDWLHPSIFDPYWQQTLIFAMALMDEEDQSALMRGLLDLGSCDPISELTGRHLEVMAKAWGAGVRYDQTIWEEWLDNEPHPDLLVTAAANAKLRAPALKVLEQLTQDGKSEVVRIEAAKAIKRNNPKLAIAVLESLAREGKYEWIRFWAAMGLGGHGPAAIPALERVAQESDGELVSHEAVEALKKLGPLAVPALERLAHEGKNMMVRFAATENLATLGSAAVPALERLAQKGKDEMVRFCATKALGALGPDLIYAFERLAREGENESGRLTAIEELNKLGSAAVPALERLARDGEEVIRLRAAEALAKQKPKVATHMLTQLARKGNELIQLGAAKALIEKSPELATPILERLARKGESERVRLWAAEAVWELNTELAIAVLKVLAEDGEDEAVRLEAAKALAEPIPELAKTTLERLARGGKHEKVRLEAVAAIGAIGPATVPILKRLTQKEEDKEVRLWAAMVLGTLDPKSGVPALEWLVREEVDERVRLQAARALGGLGVPPMGCAELSQEPN